VETTARRTPDKRLARKRDYPIIRFLVIILNASAVALLIVGLVSAGYLWLRAELLRDGVPLRGPLSDTLNPYNSSELMLGATAAAGIGLVAFLLLGAIGQFLAMQRDRAINSANQVRLLEDILELNETIGVPNKTKRVELCEGCGRLGSLNQIESGQWVCRECRRQLRSQP
jgi:hypothetical protein